MAMMFRAAFCVAILFLGSLDRMLFAAELQEGSHAPQELTLLESFKLVKGDTLWGYWITNARTREMYRNDWRDFLGVVSQFNQITEWRTVRPNTVVHIPLPSSYAVGFSISGATTQTVTIVLEQSKVGPGLYRFKEVAQEAPMPAVSADEGQEVMDAQPTEIQDLREEVLLVVEQGVETLQSELKIQKEFVATQLDRHLNWIRDTFFLMILLALLLGAILVALIVRNNATQRSQREALFLAQRSAEHERARVNIERELGEVAAAYETTKKELTDVREQFAHTRRLYDNILAETKVQMEQMTPYMYRFSVGEKWFGHPDTGKTLLIPKKTEGKRILLKPHGAEDWMLVENVETYLRDSAQARAFYGLGNPVDRGHASPA